MQKSKYACRQFAQPPQTIKTDESYTSQPLNILSSFQSTTFRMIHSIIKSVRHSCIFRKYLWLFVMSKLAKLANYLPGDRNRLGETVRTTGCRPRRWELVVLRTVRRYNVLCFYRSFSLFVCCFILFVSSFGMNAILWQMTFCLQYM